MNLMKKINFLVTDSLYQQIEKVISRLGINSKAEFFRMLAVNYLKDCNIPPPPSSSSPTHRHKSKQRLTKDEKTLLSVLSADPLLADELVNKTGLPVQKVLALLTQLFVKNLIREVGPRWVLNE
ncbi:MAG: hypothetical protein V1908_01700 [Candidatus Peregrinibacteria bacterium]